MTKKSTNKIEEFRGVVWEIKYNGQKCVTIPKDSKIVKGDYVIIRKDNDKKKYSS